MPDFSFWAWDNRDNYMGPYDQVVERIERMDIPWSEKTPQLVWRGKPSFAPKLRRALMEAARDKSWGDVKQVDWNTGSNVLRMEDHCHYMFIAHVEGKLHFFIYLLRTWNMSTNHSHLFRSLLFGFFKISTGLQFGYCRTQTPIHSTSPLSIGGRRSQSKLCRGRARF